MLRGPKGEKRPADVIGTAVSASTLANVRYGARFGLIADVAPLLRWANKRHSFLHAPLRIDVVLSGAAANVPKSPG